MISENMFCLTYFIIYLFFVELITSMLNCDIDLKRTDSQSKCKKILSVNKLPRKYVLLMWLAAFVDH